MGKKGNKRTTESLEDLLGKPWCYYCNKEFEDLKILTDHQKQKHYRCNVGGCHRRLYTAGGLKVHMQQVHKEELTKVENALEGREDPNVEIFGMEGIPAQIMRQHQDLITQQYFQMEAEYRQRTGNSLTQTGQPVTKKPKLEESKEDLKARVRALKAKKEAEKLGKAVGDGSEGSDTQTPPPSAHTPIQPPAHIPSPLQATHAHWQQPPPMHAYPGIPQHTAVGGWAPPSAASPPLHGGGFGVPPMQFPPGFNGYAPMPMAPHMHMPVTPHAYSPITMNAPPGLPQRPPQPAYTHLQPPAPHVLPPRPVTVPTSIPVAPGNQPYDSLEAMMDHAAQVATTDEYRQKREAEDRAKQGVSGTSTPVAATPAPAVLDSASAAPAAETAEPVQAKGSAKAKRKEIMKLNLDNASWEEIRAGLERYHIKRKPSSQQTVGGATDAVSGVVQEGPGESES